ncbi:GNAT family N-acetyltransferase, partial [Priestia megaterium]
MLLRKIKSEELAEVYQMGYAAWPKGRTYKEYVRDNQKEETYGIRYVYVNEEDQIIGSFILLLLQTPRLKFALHGIGSIVVHQLYQRMGYGRDMLEDFFKKMKIEKRSAIFMLYSDILPEYYHQFG